ncbi:serine/arginine repetitive matrix protein 1-like [Lutra lutra]|uniref:serine/arginine repetitive matrix protein 1-like n=1 Tax=Lutra lutra TaxID=9657 RepID=UPI001FD600EA|nr:serine/arginine repetitive matrix protein 1-like [Lutra lutra]
MQRARRARPPAHPLTRRARPSATRIRPDPAGRPRPQLAPADCRHVTPRANREGPGRARRGLLPHHKHRPETAERAAARGPGLAAAARGRPPDSRTPPSASQSKRLTLPLLRRRPMWRDFGSTSFPAESTQHSIHMSKLKHSD